jgi:hypothetical protein
MNCLTSRLALYTLAAFTFTFGGCAAPSGLQHTPDVIRRHVIAIDGNGRPHDPTCARGRALTIPEYRSQIAQIMLAMREYFRTHPDRRILLFVHGGLNAPGDSLQNADKEMDQVIAAGYYPIYLDWDSNLLGSYGDHISSITEGQTDSSVGRWLLTPFYVIADMLRAAARTPIVWVNQAAGDAAAAFADIKAQPRPPMPPTSMPTEDAKSERWARGQRGQALADTYQQLRASQDEDERSDKFTGRRKQLRIIVGPDLDVSSSHLAGLIGSYLLTTPTKFLSQPAIDWLGTPAWQNMSRRTLTVFDGDWAGNVDVDPTLLSRREMLAAAATDFSLFGALELFRVEFEKVVANHAAASGPATRSDSTMYHVTLVGHSMGTMVLNEWLRRDLLENRNLAYVNIVYMAAACSVRDFGRTVVPYLLQHQQTQFYNLMLHPLADLRERGRMYDLPPRGSLLVWLDSFLADPQTPLDRTLGRWDNIVSLLQVMPGSVRGQITMKAFALAPSDNQTVQAKQLNYGPQEHGQFRGQPYWCKEFWSSEKPLVSAIPCTWPRN